MPPGAASQSQAGEPSSSHASGSAPGAQARLKPVLTWAALALLLLVFGVVALLESRVLPPVDDSDEPGYLEESCWIAEHGGITGFPSACFRGEYPYDYRHPLVQLAASPWAERSLAAVRPMRAVKVALSLIALVVVFVVARRVVSPPAALTLTALLALSLNWFMKSRVLCPEPVIYALFFLTWVWVGGLWRPRGRWLWAGLAAGLAFLTKGTALLLPVALLVALAIHIVALWVKKRRIPAKPRISDLGWSVGLFVAGFLLAGGVLLTRNLVRFGNPVYNRSVTLMWADDWSHHLMTADRRPEKPRTMWNYLRTHSLRSMAGRLAAGISRQAPRLLGAFAPHRSFGRPAWLAGLVISAAIILLGLLATAWQSRTWTGLFTCCLVGIGFLSFAWYSPITYSSRFVATFAPIIGVQAFRADFSWLRRARQWGRTWGAWLAIGLAVVVSCLLAGRLSADTLDAQRGPIPISLEYRFLLDWYADEAAPQDAVCFQTPYLGGRYTFEWLIADRVQVYQVPPLENFDALQEYMASKRARFFVVERDSLRERFALLEGYFGFDAAGRMVVKAAPPGWKVHRRDPYPPMDFVILERRRE